MVKNLQFNSDRKGLMGLPAFFLLPLERYSAYLHAACIFVYLTLLLTIRFVVLVSQVLFSVTGFVNFSQCAGKCFRYNFTFISLLDIYMNCQISVCSMEFTSRSKEVSFTPSFLFNTHYIMFNSV